jgi:hypothetical protein
VARSTTSASSWDDTRGVGEGESEDIMDRIEAQSRAIIASALIVRGAIDVPSTPTDGAQLSQAEGLRLRALTDHLYRLLTTAPTK